MNAVMRVGMSIVTYVYAIYMCVWVCVYVYKKYIRILYIYIYIYVNMNTLQGTVICTLNPNP